MVSARLFPKDPPFGTYFLSYYNKRRSDLQQARRIVHRTDAFMTHPFIHSRVEDVVPGVRRAKHNSRIREKHSAFLRVLLIRSLRDHLPHIKGKALGCARRGFAPFRVEKLREAVMRGCHVLRSAIHGSAKSVPLFCVYSSSGPCGTTFPISRERLLEAYAKRIKRLSGIGKPDKMRGSLTILRGAARRLRQSTAGIP